MGRKRAGEDAEVVAISKPKKGKTKEKIRLNVALGICITDSLNKKILAEAKKAKIKKSALLRNILEERFAKTA